MGVGNLIIQARTADEALPLGDVQIKVFDQQGKEQYNLYTDSAGKGGPISLSTVDRALSLNPTYKGTPFTSYTVMASKAGYASLTVEGVHIFDGETAIQPIPLLPVPNRLRGIAYNQTITLSEPAVISSKQRHQEGGGIGRNRVFGEVFIPNPITVHLGTPDSNAANVKVSFTDYVKNVASCEIFSTWPVAALEANILVIITFALNRVFTEWYRSKGYNFDITSSTTVDQSYQYGHTIYQNISEIVDEIYNEYIVRPGHIEPYFTAFCNGTTVTCDGLSQWGTVDLANQGMSALEILRYYYPDDIIITETDAIAGITSSFPGTALRNGSTGQAVETIQVFLNRIRKVYSAIPAITDLPGVYGSSTAAAVKAFQSIFNLTADGVVGKATWYKISALYTAITKLASLDSEGTSLGIGTIPPSAVLKSGSSGVDVLTLQYILSYLASFYPTLPSVSQDGFFGSGLSNAVKAFQKMRGLPTDGVVGPATWAALYETYWSVREDTPVQTPPAGGSEYVVKAGDTLWLIAQRFGTTVAAIKSLNRLTSDVLTIGQILMIPNSDTTTPEFDYVVRSGDSLWSLAQRFGTTTAAIKALNGLSGDTLYIGQTLRIPTQQSYAAQIGEFDYPVSDESKNC
jgi:LysM repeat protein